MKYKYSKQPINIFQIVVSILLLLPLVFYGWRINQRVPRNNIQQQLFSGIFYQQKIYSQPRPYIVHQVEIDLNDSQIEPFVTPKNDDNYLAMTTSDFVTQFDLQLAINGSFFYPFKEETPWRFYPQTGDLVNGLGESVIDGQRFGEKGDRWNVLCFSETNQPTIVETFCPPNTIWGVAGREMLVKDRVSLIKTDTNNYGRSAVGVDFQNNKLWLIVVDGKQPFYSEGVTLEELAMIFVNLGCDRALNLDGGGSTTLAIEQGNDVVVLNAPIHTKIPMRERPIANHLGFFAASSP